MLEHSLPSADSELTNLPSPATNNSIQFESDLFAVHFVRQDQTATDFSIDLYGPDGVFAGSVELSDMPLADSRLLTEEMLGMGEALLPHDLGAHLHAVELLASTLNRATELGITISSELGTTPAEITSEYGDIITANLSVDHHRRLLSVQEVAPNIYHITAPTNYQLASTFLRFQEHFESPHFRGKDFELEEYKEWYRSQSASRSFSYYFDWGGFNFPDYILEAVATGNFAPLSNKEKALLSLFQDIQPPFYIIGTAADNRNLAETVRHELGHAQFYLNEKYREEVRAALATVPTIKIENYIRKMGYHESSVEDETHAYLLDPLSYLVSEAGIDAERYQNVHRRLLRIFKKHYQPN